MREIIGLIIFVASVYALYQVITSNATTGKKILWCLGILIFPVLGFIVWYFAGPKKAAV
ncbi:hypothetical protein PARPLA_00997 [Rhodobacteraceae bacterium THAF1]|uniref:PLD nuclease N-terminal domain-containing protein n=1 Tax=Palleronia sp. THAF1 TaxID=2587842 RepID=UPI000F3B574E|nr:PLD nuclease N-terminal domain-containing protein [Palleronia sp. THAF1]QFU07533.1 hypothetical protein FIU81_02460 [Palleronia sp. THAF1]VDC20496.1 hypothetical protein PARPLA_00997 [Rhodobacteraceae bacterium THAF1]